MAHAFCVLCNLGQRDTLRICNTYFFTQRQWLRERASILRLNAHCLSCLSTTAPQSSVSSFSICHSSWTNFLGAKILCDADDSSHCTHYGITSLRHEFQKQSCENLNHFSFFLPFCHILFIYSWVFYQPCPLLILLFYNFQSMGDQCHQKMDVKDRVRSMMQKSVNLLRVNK